MKATLEFTLPDEREEHLVAVHAENLYFALYEIDGQLRNWLKHGHEFKTADEALEAVREFLNDELRDRNCSLEMMS